MMMDGSIWEQTDFTLRYRFAYSPKVVLIPDGIHYKMRVGEEDETVQVQKLR